MKSDSAQSSVRMFELVPDEPERYYVEARHRWGLPGVKCDSCQATWANVGIAYPTVDLSSLPTAERYARSWPVTWDQFDDARRAVLQFLPANAVVPPGTALGPLIGTARGVFPHVAWQNPWTMLLRTDALEQLRAKGVRHLTGRAAQFTGREIPELVELELEPRGRMSGQSFSPSLPCTRCGRQPIVRPTKIAIDRSSVATDRDIFRLTDLTTMIVATERAVSEMVALGLRGFRQEEVSFDA